MKVTIVRHGKVKHIWKESCNSTEFDHECMLYDNAPIEDVECSIDHTADKVYISTLDRTLQTGKKMFGEREFIASKHINEVPLRSSFDTRMRLPLWFWNMSGRLQWLVNSKRQVESRKQTIKRAESFVQDIIGKNEDCVLITHGFFMHTLISEMKRKGFKSGKTGIHYKNCEAITMTLS